VTHLDRGPEAKLSPTLRTAIALARLAQVGADDMSRVGPVPLQEGEGERDYVLELGSQRLIPEIESELTGMSPGETKEIPYGDGQTVEATVKLARELKTPVIASGGIASLQDIHHLMPYSSEGIIGAIAGRALYEGKLDFKEALKAAKGT